MVPVETVKKVIRAGLENGGEFAELYVEDRVSLLLRLDDQKLEDATRGADRGADAQAGEPLPPTGLARFERLFEVSVRACPQKLYHFDVCLL